MMTLAAAAVAAGSGAAPAARAQETKGPVNDQLFVMAASAGGMAEVSVSQLAADRASSEEVKKLAQHLITDHTKANQELTSLAATKRVAVVTSPEVSAQAAAECLAGLRGEDFDREFVKHQVAAHMCAVQLFEAEAERGRDADIKAFASRTLPTLREHLRMAREHAQRERREASKGREERKESEHREHAKDREKSERKESKDREKSD